MRRVLINEGVFVESIGEDGYVMHDDENSRTYLVNSVVFAFFECLRRRGDVDLAIEDFVARYEGAAGEPSRVRADAEYILSVFVESEVITIEQDS